MLCSYISFIIFYIKMAWLERILKYYALLDVRDLWNDLSEDVTWIVKLGMDQTNSEMLKVGWEIKIIKKRNYVDSGIYIQS